MVVLITSQSNHILAKEERVKSAGETIAAKVKSFKWTNSNLRIVSSNKSKVCLCFNDKFLLVIKWQIIFRIKHPLVEFDVFELLLRGRRLIVHIIPQ